MNEQSSKKGIPTCICCLTCYFVAGMTLSLVVLPPEAFAIFGVTAVIGHAGIALAVADTFLVLGVVLHAILYRRNPERFDMRTFRSIGIGMCVVMAGLFGFSFVLARTTGLPPAVLERRFNLGLHLFGLAAVALVVISLAILFAYVFVVIKLHPANRMARRLAAGDLAGAIRIGEARPEHKRDFLTNYNLAAAYANSGSREKAKRILAMLEQTDKTPKYCTPEAVKQMLDYLREVLGQESQPEETRKDEAP